MSKYTTMVRYIAEHDAGLTESVGFDQVDQVLDQSWNKIFTTKTKFFDEAYRAPLCKKILKHYYMREIGAETSGLWKLWMNTRLEEIMPYYNQLYASELLSFDPLQDVDLTRQHTRDFDGKKDSTDNMSHTTNTKTSSSSTRNDTGSGESKDDGTTSSDGTTNTVNSNTKRDLYSDTPQGALTGVESETYLTNARKITDGGNTDVTDHSEGTTSSTGSYSNKADSLFDEEGSSDVTGSQDTTGSETIKNTEDYLEKVTGRNGGRSPSELLLKFRETFLNIDTMVIEAFSDLFMGLW